jgi:hypothetical protein
VLVFLCIRRRRVKHTSYGYFTTYDVPSLLSVTYAHDHPPLQYQEPDMDPNQEPNMDPYVYEKPSDILCQVLSERQGLYRCAHHGMPIIFDTGASMSVTPLREDFVGVLGPPKIPNLRGLKGTVKVVGTGTVEWTIFDVQGLTRTIRTEAMFVPECNIRLLSPQVYFQQHMKGCAKVDAMGLSWSLPDGTILRFPYAGVNLPIMLTKLRRWSHDPIH